MQQKINSLTVDILAVDDLEGDLLATLLIHARYAVAVVISADEALAWLKVNRAKVAVIDLALPGKSGLWLIEQIRELYETLPIIVLTGHEPTKAIKQTLAGFGIGKVLEKKLGIEELLRELKEILTI